MKVLFIGDIVGQSGQNAISQFLPALKQTYKPQVTIANAENISNGRGISEKHYRWLLQKGIDVVTMGNHTWDDRDIFNFIDQAKVLVRPFNLPATTTPGQGVHYVRVNEIELAIVNVLGNVFMQPALNPFFELPKLVAQIRQRTPFIFVDFHAEATSEKQALAYLLDGQISALVGTHTHVQTADGQVLPKGTGYLTDVGMTGARVSILGSKVEEVLKRFTSQMPQRLTPMNTEDVLLNAVLLTLDQHTGLTKKVEPISLNQHNYQHFIS